MLKKILLILSISSLLPIYSFAGNNIKNGKIAQNNSSISGKSYARYSAHQASKRHKKRIILKRKRNKDSGASSSKIQL